VGGVVEGEQEGLQVAAPPRRARATRVKPGRANPARERPPRRRPRRDLLRSRFDALASTFGIEHISPDPLEVVLECRDPRDAEVVAFLGAGLAFGSAQGAVTSLRALLARLPSSPAASAIAWEHPRDRARLAGWRHRWLGAEEASLAIAVLGRVLREHGSVEAFFAAGDPGPEAGDPIGAALASFAARGLALAPPHRSRHLRYFFAGPGGGGASKRMCLFLRFMCRKDGIDPGTWTCVDPSRLVIPLDTHVARIARYVGLLRRKSADWRAALELTAELRAMDASDPVKFDYALCRLGILGTCPKRRHARKCHACPLFEVCLL
jgi:uncharacterized protein (TIGR02757 family)